jgi:chitodextrinase
VLGGLGVAARRSTLAGRCSMNRNTRADGCRRAGVSPRARAWSPHLYVARAFVLAGLVGCFGFGCEGGRESDRGGEEGERTDSLAENVPSAPIGFEILQRQRGSGEMIGVEPVDGRHTVDVDLPVRFEADLGAHADDAASLAWDFGDAAKRTGWNVFRPNTRHTFSGPGQYEVSLGVVLADRSTLRATAVVVAESRDEQPPAPPADVDARSVTPSQVDLAWTAPEEEVRVALYRVLRNGAAVGTSTYPDYSDADTQPATRYRYTVAAVDATGNVSAESKPVEIVTLEVGHFDPRIEIRAVSGTQIDMQWSNVESANAQQYGVYRGEQEVGRGPSGFFSDSHLQPSTTHTYSVALLDAAGEVVARSPMTEATTLPASGTVPFTLAVLPDTQIYTRYYPAIFESQTRWIRRNRVRNNIVYALHEGDITDTNTEVEWKSAMLAIGLLDGYVPYALSVGNHDVSGALGTTLDSTRFNTYFQHEEIARRADFGGVFEVGRLDNAYYSFQAGGLAWLVLVLELAPRSAALDWAKDVVARYADHNVIVLTHSYLSPDDLRNKARAPTGSDYGDPDGDRNAGEAIWQKLVRRHANMRIVLCGHELGDGIGRLVSEGDHGNRVHQMLANYQMRPLGGGGNLRLLEIDTNLDRISVTTYSPYLDRFVENTAEVENRFIIEDMGFVRPAR